MKYQVVFLPNANDDLVESISWYDVQKEKLGVDFYNSVVEMVDIIGMNPQLFTVQFKSVRAAPLKKFPFLIFYKFEKIQQRVVVFAILHQSRNPKTWKNRV
jgi:ParE toxin of type II toxin-antitoxin system, parDE